MAEGTVTTNTLESFWEKVKTAIIGNFHWVSRKHAHRYLAELEGR